MASSRQSPVWTLPGQDWTLASLYSTVKSHADVSLGEKASGWRGCYPHPTHKTSLSMKETSLWSFHVQTHGCQEASGRKRFRGCQMIRAYFEVQKGSPLSYLQPLTSAISSTWTDVSPFRILQSYIFLKAGPKFYFIEEIFLIPQPGKTFPSSGHYRFALVALAMLCTEVTTLNVH